MEYISKDASDKRIKKLKRVIKKQANIQKKAEIVMSKNPPGPQFSFGVKAKYSMPKKKIDLPPLKIKAKERKKCMVSCETPIPGNFKNLGNLGILQGIPKYLNQRKFFKSVEFGKNKSNLHSYSFTYKTPEPLDELTKMPISQVSNYKIGF